jgi:hypothetical protein
MRKVRNITLALFALLMLLSSRAYATQNSCPTNLPSECNCNGEGIYCDFWPFACDQGTFDATLNEWCGDRGCAAYGTSYGATDCDGWCIGCPEA